VKNHDALIERLRLTRTGDEQLWEQVARAIRPASANPIKADEDLLTFHMQCNYEAWADAALMLVPPGWSLSMRQLPDGSGWCAADTGTPRSRQYSAALYWPAAICVVALKIDAAVGQRLAESGP
jgi:hypothetical protein